MVLQPLTASELQQLRESYDLVELGVDFPPHHGLQGRHLFVDLRKSSRQVTDRTHHFDVVVVTDLHALAAHELWHRRTKLLWAQPPEGITGALQQVSVLDREGHPGGLRFVTISFRHKFLTVTVDFYVVQVEPHLFEVEVVKEYRHHLAPFPDESDPEYDNFCQEYLPLHVKLNRTIAETPKAVGTVRMTEILDGVAYKCLRQAADRIVPTEG